MLSQEINFVKFVIKSEPNTKQQGGNHSSTNH